MPRNQGTSRKGKPGKLERAVGMGNALKRAQRAPKARGNRGEGGMSMQPGMTSIGENNANTADPNNTKSVLELNSLDDFLLQADLANREFESQHESLVVLDNTAGYTGSNSNGASSGANNGKNSALDNFVFTELSVPRRPAWDESTTPVELQTREQEAFLDWRRKIAMREEQLVAQSSSAAATPFEKNLQVWRQLWRVLERSSCLLQLVDARNPLFYLSQDLKDYATSLNNKPMMILLNKSDYLTAKQRQVWKDYLEERGWECVFFSAKQEQAKLDAKAQAERRQIQQQSLDLYDPVSEADDESNDDDDDDDGVIEDVDEVGSENDYNDDDDETHNDKDEKDVSNTKDENDTTENASNVESQDGCGVDVPLTRLQLIDTLVAFARKHDCQPDERYDNRIQFGFVGFPNVGKSSVINVLMGSSKHAHGITRVAVAAQPGKTKHFQTLLLPDSDELMLCDCPGLVFPSFVSNTADLIAAGVYPIAQMRDHWPVVNLICQRIPRAVLNAHYSINIPEPSELDMRERGWTTVPPPTAEEFLTTLCVTRSMLSASSGVPDFTRAARMVIKDYADGTLLYCHPPPKNDKMAFYRETFATSMQYAKKRREQQTLQEMQQQHEEIVSTQKEAAYHDDESAIDLEFLDLHDSADSDNNGQHEKRGRQRIRSKWGKKNRKFRDKDPYGCHAPPDELLSKEVATGIVVNAGKHSYKNYTRRVGYGSTRGATVQMS